jgi:sugar transferase (PEP-CTERM/EpsH1 system associated)
MKKIRIFHVLHSLRTGGLENGVINLINELNSNRFDHVICCIDSSGPMAERLARPVQICTLQKGDKRAYLLPFKIAKIIRKMNPDIVHTRNWGAIDGIVAARLAGVRSVIHGEHGREATDPTGGNSRRRRIRKALRPLVKHFVAVSEELKTWLIEDVGISKEKITRIMNGVNTERFVPVQDKMLAKVRLGLDSGSLIIGTVGRLDPVKDYETLLRACARVIAQCGTRIGEVSSIKVLIIGSGPLEDKLRCSAKELGIEETVLFLGERNNVPEILQAMDVFVLPSVTEGISNTILEAMACGLPVVATKVGGNSELINDNITGFLFPVGNDEKLGQILVDYISNPEMMRAHGEKGRTRCEAHFSLSRMVEAYAQLYCSLA